MTCLTSAESRVREPCNVKVRGWGQPAPSIVRISAEAAKLLDLVIIKPRAPNDAVDVCRSCNFRPHAKLIADETLDSTCELYFTRCAALVPPLAHATQHKK